MDNCKPAVRPSLFLWKRTTHSCQLFPHMRQKSFRIGSVFERAPPATTVLEIAATLAPVRSTNPSVSRFYQYPKLDTYLQQGPGLSKI